MLEQMREQTGSLIIWVLFAIIIAAFVLFFGSPSDSIGCSGANIESALEVDDTEVGDDSWRFAYNGIPFIYGNIPGDQRRPIAMDILLMREILAQEAESMDFRVSDDVVNDAIKNGEWYFRGIKIDGTRIYFEHDEDGKKQPIFEYKLLENFASRLGLPNMRKYKSEMKREMLAYFMAQEIVLSGAVSREEARQAFVDSNTTVSAEYVKFEPARYMKDVVVSEETAKSFAANHEDKLKEEWESVKGRWESEKARVRARVIKIAKGSKADADKDVDAKDESAAADEGKAAIDAALARIQGGESFATVAAEVSEDNSAKLGGYIGWRASDSLGYGQEVVDGIKDLKEGETSKVIAGSNHYYLVKVEKRSDKGLSFDDKKLDLASKLAPMTLAKELAKADAEKALAAAQTTPLSELFEKAAPAPSFDMNNLPPELLEQLSEEQLQQMMIDAASKQGAIVTEGRTRLAQAGGEEPAPAKAKTADAKPAAKPAAKEAAPEEEAVGADAAESDSSVAKPSLQSVQNTTRNGDFIAGLGRSQEVVDALFNDLSIGSLGSQVYEVEESDGYVVVQLTDRTEADMDQFQERAEALQTTLSRVKGQELFNQWVLDRCNTLKKKGKVRASQSLLTSGDKRIPYEPCTTIEQLLSNDLNQMRGL